MKRFALFAAMLTLGLASCGEDPVAEQEPVMVIDPTSMTIQLRSIKETFEIPVESTETVTATIGWPVGTTENDKGWLTDITSKGTRALTASRFKFEAQKNEGSSERKATITLTMGTVSKTFSVIQGVSSDIAMDLTVEQWPDGASGQIQEGGLGYRMTGISEFGDRFFVKVNTNFPWSVKFDDAASWVKQVSGGITAGGFMVEVKAARDNTVFDYANRITVVHVTLDNGAQSRDLVIQQNPRTPGSYLIDIPEDEKDDQYKPGDVKPNGTLAEKWNNSRIAKMILNEVEEFREGLTKITIFNAEGENYKMTARDFEAIDSLVPRLKKLDLSRAIADTIPAAAFQRASAAQTLEEVSLPPGLLSIEKGAFKGCYKLTTLTGGLPKTMINIGDEAFLGATLSNTDIQIPNTMQYLGSAAFAGHSLKTLSFEAPTATEFKGDIKVEGKTDKLLEIGDYAFFSPMTHLSPVDKKAIVAPAANSSKVQNITTEINPNQASLNGAAINMSGGFRVPDWVSRVGKGAFYGISYRSSNSGTLTIGKNVNYLGEGAFFMNRGVNNIAFEAGVDITIAELVSLTGSSEIWHGVFSGTNVTSAKFPIDARIPLTHVPNRIYAYCDKLQTVTMDNTIDVIRASAFQGSSISQSITFSTGLDVIYAQAFADTPVLPTLDMSGCTKLETIYGNFVSQSEGVETIKFPNSLKSITTPYTATSTSVSTSNMFSWTNETLSRNTTTTGEGASAVTTYTSRSKLKEIDFSNTQLVSIPNTTFLWCRSLEVVKLPSTIKFIGGGGNTAAGPTPPSSVFTGTAIKKVVFPASMAPGGDATSSAWPAGVTVYKYAFGRTFARGYTTAGGTDEVGAIVDTNDPASITPVPATYE